MTWMHAGRLASSAEVCRERAGTLAHAVVDVPPCAATPAICEVKHARIEDAEFAYVEAGSGDPIVLVRGGLQDYRLWEAHLPAFSGKYRAIADSRRNHYPNTTSIDAAPDNAADLHAEDLAATSAGGGYYQLIPTHAPSKCLDVSEVSTANGANVQIWGCLGGTNQQCSFQTP